MQLVVSIRKDRMGEGNGKKRGRGRPRRDGSSSGNQRSEIISAALEQFKTQGYTATSMSSIARSAGLDQSSIYYWFSSKDDILLEAVEGNEAFLRSVPDIDMSPGHSPELLYAVIYADTLTMCRMPFDYYMIEDVASGQPGRFSDFESRIQELVHTVRQIIEDGIADGSFIECDAAFEALATLSIGEGVQHGLHTPRHLDLFSEFAIDPSALDLSKAADTAASAAVGRLLAQGNVADVRSRAHELGLVEEPADRGTA